VFRRALAIALMLTAAAACDPLPDVPAQDGRAAACAIPERYRGQDLERMPVEEKLVALTFDAGANADGVPSILATLAAKRVPGTFFLTGNFVRAYPKRAARIAELHLVGNHTRTHADLTTLSDAAIATQVRTAETAIRDVTGEDPRRFFRFPMGARTAHEIGILNRLCYVPFRWTVDTLGWKGTRGGQSVATVIARVMAAAKPGAIVLMHVGSHPKDGTTLDADALPQIIDKLRRSGYRLVPLARVMSPAP
jgi:peptidoglycan/xylan/chitin deacetylase (PgdA/CDA1 family)